MGDYIYYCEVKTRVREIPAGVYKVVAGGKSIGPWFPTLNRLTTVSDRVWKQGPKGGVKIVKYPWRYGWPMGYITHNEKFMKEFMWAKLKSKSL